MADRIHKVLEWLVNLYTGRGKIEPISQEQWDEAVREDVLAAPRRQERRTHTANYPGGNYVISIGPF